jgi:MFS family permease
MTLLDDSPVMVSAVRTAMALPLLCLALPAGVLADRVDRRRLLIATQCWMLSVAALLATLTCLGLVTPVVLLALTSAMGLGMVLHAPTWQASVPELVPREQLSSAIALGSISFNLARAVGPALGGLLIAWLGAWSPFAVNAGSFAGVIGVLLCWRREESESSHGKSFLSSLREGVGFAYGNRDMRYVLLRVLLYVIPASALWALLPLVAQLLLGWEAVGYGMLVGGIGLGAVLAAGVMPQLRYRFGAGWTLVIAHFCMASSLVAIGANWGGMVTLVVMLLSGGGWMMALTTMNSSAQMLLPRQLRARGMACYLMAFAAAMSGGALVWGRVARRFDVSTALMIAAACLVITAIALPPKKASDTHLVR